MIHVYLYFITTEKNIISEFSLCQVINNHITNRKYLTMYNKFNVRVCQNDYIYPM